MKRSGSDLLADSGGAVQKHAALGLGHGQDTPTKRFGGHRSADQRGKLGPPAHRRARQHMQWGVVVADEEGAAQRQDLAVEERPVTERPIQEGPVWAVEVIDHVVAVRTRGEHRVAPRDLSVHDLDRAVGAAA